MIAKWPGRGVKELSIHPSIMHCQLIKDSTRCQPSRSRRPLSIRTQVVAIFIIHIVVCWSGYLASGHAVLVDGDLIMGGLFPVHEKAGQWCSSRLYNRGLQRLEAMLFAIDKINANKQLLPGIKLGVNILDTCSLDTHALNQSLAFIKASLDVMDTESFVCDDRSSPKPRFKRKPVVGVIGGSYSSVSISVANLFRLFRIPQISPASTAEVLSDKTRYEFFARTVPPDTFQATVLVDIVRLFNWSYVSTVASVGSYGQSGIEAFHQQAEQRNICIAVQQIVPRDAATNTFDKIIVALLKRPMARGVVLFVRAEDARGILLAAKRRRLKQPFFWIASDGWGKQKSLLQGVEDVAVGAVTVELTSQPLTEFDQYMASLTPTLNTRNPWFSEYWRSFFNCDLNKSSFSNLPPDGTRDCDPSNRLLPEYGFVQESKVQFVVDAVYAFGYALQALHRDVCTQSGVVCRDMLAFDGGEFYTKYLLNVSFTGMAGSSVLFDRRGDGPARYTVFNYQSVPNDKHVYRVIGNWSDSHLQMRVEDVRWSSEIKQDVSINSSSNVTSFTVPVSVCALPCGVGEVKKMKGSQCCWICDKCEPHEYMEDENTCRDCGPGRWPYSDRLSCYALQVQYMQWTSPFALVPMSIALLGIVLTAAVMIVFIKNEDTPLVKASGRELSYMLLAGILICYLNTFILLAKPGTITCALQRVGVGLGFAFIYGALFTKTNRISRIFDAATYSAKRPSFISPRSQIVIASMLVGVQLLATVLWLLLKPPGYRFHYPKRDEVVLKCNIKDSSFFVSLVYNMMLIVVCTVYAVKARKVPENFNESKFIAFTMYTTCIIWLAFVPIYFGTGNSYEVQITTLCVAISLSATVALICLYAPKVYIIVLHPEKNVRKLTMSSAAYRKGQGSTLVSVNHAGAATTDSVRLNVAPSGETSSSAAVIEQVPASSTSSTRAASLRPLAGEPGAPGGVRGPGGVVL